MRKFLVLVGLGARWLGRVVAGETVQLKMQPDQSVLLTGDPREVVVKIDLASCVSNSREKRGPANIVAVWTVPVP